MMKRLIFLFCIINIALLSANDQITVRVGVYENSPKIFTSDTGEVKGFWADITNFIAEQENWQIEWIHGTWDECLQRLQNDEIDLMVDVAVNPKREKLYSFPDETVHLSWTRIYRITGNDIYTILDLDGKKIAGLKNSFDLEGPEGLRKVAKDFQIDCEIIEMDTYINIFQALEKKEIDAGITDKDFGNIHDANFNIEKTAIVLQPAHMKYAFSKNSGFFKHFAHVIDDHIKQLKMDDDSIFYKSHDRYLSVTEKVFVLPLWLKFLLFSISILATTFLVFIWIFKVQLRKKTKELHEDILKREQVEFELRDRKKELEQIFEAISDALVYSDAERKMIRVNSAFSRLFGYNVDEILGKRTKMLYANELDFEKQGKIRFNQQAKDTYEPYEISYKRKNNEIFPSETIGSPVRDSRDQLIGYISIIRDISIRKKTEMETRKNMEEKNALLRELYHRTKNNMQLISSMIKLEIRFHENKLLHDTLINIVNRIYAMSLVHEKLYQEGNLSYINLKKYIIDLISYLLTNYRISPNQIKIRYELMDIHVLIDSAIPFGLVINELIVNSFKHAFPENRKGVIEIKLVEIEKNIHLTISDDGVGISPDQDILASESIGLNVIKGLIEQQLKGTVRYESNNGLKWDIIFADNIYEERV